MCMLCLGCMICVNHTGALCVLITRLVCRLLHLLAVLQGAKAHPHHTTMQERRREVRRREEMRVEERVVSGLTWSKPAVCRASLGSAFTSEDRQNVVAPEPDSSTVSNPPALNACVCLFVCLFVCLHVCLFVCLHTRAWHGSHELPIQETA